MQTFENRISSGLCKCFGLRFPVRIQPRPTPTSGIYFQAEVERTQLFVCDRDELDHLPPPMSTSIDTPVNVKSLRALKNSVIGNPSAKASLAQDEAFVRVSVFNLSKQRPVKLTISARLHQSSRLSERTRTVCRTRTRYIHGGRSDRGCTCHLISCIR